jgi:hypothetical protein
MGRRVFDACERVRAASIYHALGIDPEITLYDRQRRPNPVLPTGQVIPGLFA